MLYSSLPASIMHIFPAIFGKLRRDVNDDKEVLQDRDFPFIHHTVDSDSGCLEEGVRMFFVCSILSQCKQ